MNLSSMTRKSRNTLADLWYMIVQYMIVTLMRREQCLKHVQKMPAQRPVKKMMDADITKGVGKAFVAEVSRQLEEDIPIWENKKYVDPPALCDGDGPIGAFRKWCKQFYVEEEAEPEGKLKSVQAA